MSLILRITGAVVVVASFAGGIDAAATAIAAELERPAPQAAEIPVDTGAVSRIAFEAAFHALIGRAEEAHGILVRLSEPDRARALSLMFDAAHPVADAGDERAAGPVMELVVHFQPTHYMALYHAGMAARAGCRHDAATQYLSNFLEYYSAEDGWRTNALDALRQLSDPGTTEPSCSPRTGP